MTEQAPRVSVIIPVYNGERYLGAALDSVLAQSYRNFEVIVIDDGSTDASARVIERYSPSLRPHHQRNAGTGAARNRGVDAARGTLLAFLDQDDLWAEDKLETQLALLDARPSVDAVFDMVNQFHSPELGDDFRDRVRCPDGPIAGYSPSAMLVRRAAFDRVGRFVETWRLAEWTDWFVRAIDAGLAIHLMPRVVTHRRLHEANKGLALRSFQYEYPLVMKALLDRRRSEVTPSPPETLPCLRR